MEKMTEKEAFYIEKAVREHINWQEARRLEYELGLEQDTIILRKYWELMLKFRFLLYNPDDKGSAGKFGEVLDRFDTDGRSWVRWHDFNARRSNRRDLNKKAGGCERKGGAGDWLRSTINGTFEGIIEEYRRAEKRRIRWHSDSEKADFDISCTYAELFAYLEAYNPKKGLATWFKPQVVKRDVFIVQLQTWTSSAKKIAYLEACPYHWEGEDED